MPEQDPAEAAEAVINESDESLEALREDTEIYEDDDDIEDEEYSEDDDDVESDYSDEDGDPEELNFDPDAE